MQESRNFNGKLYLKDDSGESVSNVDNTVFRVEEFDLGFIKDNFMLQEFSADKDWNYLNLIHQWMELCRENPHEQLKHKFNGTLYDNINNKKYHVEGLFPSCINGAFATEENPTKTIITFKYNSKVEETTPLAPHKRQIMTKEQLNILINSYITSDATQEDLEDDK